MKLLEITVGWTQYTLKLFGTKTIRNASKYLVAQIDISDDGVRCQTIRIVR